MNFSSPFRIEVILNPENKLSEIGLVQATGADSDTHFSPMVRACLKELPSKELINAIDWTKFSPFQTLVYKALLTVKPGETISYQGLAKKMGKPEAARAVGTALGKNPFLIVIPCHRVIRENGELGGFAAGLDIKKTLLNLEKTL